MSRKLTLLPTLAQSRGTPQTGSLSLGCPAPDALAVMFKGECEALSLHGAACTQRLCRVAGFALGREEEGRVDPGARRSTDPIRSYRDRVIGVVKHDSVSTDHDT